MKKKMILTGLFGALVGVALSTLITLAISLMHNNGHYYAVVPELIAFCGSEELTQANVRSFDRLFFRNAADRLLHVVDAAHTDRLQLLFRPVLRNLRRDLAD